MNAQVDRNRNGGNRETGFRAKHESAVGNADAPSFTDRIIALGPLAKRLNLESLFDVRSDAQ